MLDSRITCNFVKPLIELSHFLKLEYRSHSHYDNVLLNSGFPAPSGASPTPHRPTRSRAQIGGAWSFLLMAMRLKINYNFLSHDREVENIKLQSLKLIPLLNFGDSFAKELRMFWLIYFL